MSGIPWWTDAKNSTYKQWETSGRETGTMPNLLWPIIAETDSDVVHCPTVGNCGVFHHEVNLEDVAAKLLIGQVHMRSIHVFY